MIETGNKKKGRFYFMTYTWSMPASITLPGGTKREYTYNPLMMTKSINVKDPGQNPLMTYNYQYSPSENITAKNTEHGNYAYNYDSLYQLTEAINPILPTEEYTYDKVGNRLAASGISYTHNANNELTSVDSTTYSYDQNGNTTQENKNSQITKYIYNTSDRLERVELPDGRVATYTYDPFGRRIKKDVNGQITYYVYSDEGLIGEYDSTGNIQKAYGWIPDSIWGTNPVFMQENNNYYFYHNDHLGTPQKLTDINGRVVWSATYTAFGEAIVDSSSTVINNLRFPCQYYDSETGKHYNWNRYYDPKTGRYISEDPIGFEGGINFYAYVSNNPLKYVDPTGEVPLVVIIPIIGGAINAVITGADEYLCSGNIGDALLAGGRGFVSGAVGTAVGLGVGIATKNPALTGSAAGLAGNITDQLLSGRGIGSLDPVDAALSTGFGAVGGVAGNAVLPPGRGRPPSLLIPRGPSNFGPKSAGLVGQEAIGGTVSSTLGVAGTNVRGKQCGCAP